MNSSSPIPGRHHDRVINLLGRLSARITGQDEILARLVNSIQRRELGVVPQRGTCGAFLFAGPTGVGKTFLAEQLAAELFGPDQFHEFDCSEFKTLDKYDELFGNRSGDSGRLFQAYERVPEGIWLFDEFEKAHPQFGHIFLQAIGAGRLTTASGTSLDLSKLYIILTTNLGSAAIVGREHLPFASLEAHVCRALEGWIRPELMGRFGKPFVFRPLTRESQRNIAQSRVNLIVEVNRALGRNVTIDPDVIDFLICRGYSRRLGARPLIQVIDELVGDAIRKDLIAGGNGSGRIVVSGDELRLIR